MQITGNPEIFSGNASCSVICNEYYITYLDFTGKSFVISLEIVITDKGIPTRSIIGVKEQSQFISSVFNPASDIAISNYIFNKNDSTISFSLSGRIRERDTQNQLTFHVDYDRVNLKVQPCNSPISMTGQLTTNQVTREIENTPGFGTVEVAASFANGTEFSHYFYLTGGYRAVLQSTSKRFNEYLSGSYPINGQTKTPIQLSFQRFKGSTNPANFNRYVEDEWEQFITEGMLTVERTGRTAPEITSGSLTFTAKSVETGSVYRFHNGRFAITSR